MRADREGGPLAVGQMLDDKYRIDALLEVGGMGAVYVGSHTKLQKRVAIKVLRSELCHAQEIVERFLREAVAASRIGHENIVEVTDIGKAQNDAPFIVMELLEGENLAARIKRRGPMPVPEACHIAVEILSAMDAAHRAGIVHRDLKPENVFLARKSRSESVKILDFGISRMIQPEDGQNRLTLTGLVMGTPYYMSPEQACGDTEITATADVYAVGVILYEMLTAKVPFEATNYNSLIYKVLSGQFPPARSYVSLPETLELIVHRAMALKSEHRYASAAELAHALEPFLPVSTPSHPFPLVQWNPTPAGGFAPQGASASMGAVQAVSAVPGTGPVESGRILLTADTVADSGPRAQRLAAHELPSETPVPRRSSRGAFAAIAAVVLLGGVGAGIALLQTRAGDEAPAQAAPPAATAAPEPVAPAAPAAPATTAPAEAAAPATTEPPAAPPDPAAEPVTLTFLVTPPDAVIKSGGVVVEGGQLSAPRSSPQVEIEVSREGYVSKKRMVSFEANREVEVVLQRKPGRRAAGRGQKPAKPEAPKPGDKRIITDSPYD
jgi:tRNA A-37 threonylcarbamoyl transferase component Bud32